MNTKVKSVLLHFKKQSQILSQKKNKQKQQQQQTKQCGGEYPVVITCSVFLGFLHFGGEGSVLSFNSNCDTERHHRPLKEFIF